MNYSNQLELSGIYDRYNGISSYASYLAGCAHDLVGTNTPRLYLYHCFYKRLLSP